ncbi:glycosyltransferase [Clostridium saccharoperbutylacetonicum]
MKIAVVIPTYNSGPFIIQTLDSILTQSNKVDRIIIIDDCSKDNTIDLVKPYLKNYDNLELIVSDRNLGPAGIRNYALKYVNEEFVMFLDHDDLLHNNLIKEYKETLNNKNNVVFIYSDAVQIDINDKIISDSVVYNFTNKNDVLGDFIVRNRILSMTGILINTTKLKEIGGFDEKLIYSQDWDLWLRLINKGDIIHVSKTLINIRRHFNNTSRNIENFLKDELAIYNKYSLDFLKHNILIRSLNLEDNLIDYISVLIKIGFWDEAYKELENINESYQKYFYIGLYHVEKSKDYAKAKECFEACYNIDNDCIEAINNLGVCYFYLNDKSRALECFEKAYKYNKEYIDAKNNFKNITKSDFELKITRRMLRRVLTRYEN